MLITGSLLILALLGLFTLGWICWKKGKLYKKEINGLRSQLATQKEFSARLESRLAEMQARSVELKRTIDASLDEFNELLKGAAAVGEMTEKQKTTVADTCATIKDIATVMSKVVDEMADYTQSFNEGSRVFSSVVEVTQKVEGRFQETQAIAEKLRNNIQQGRDLITDTVSSISGIKEVSDEVGKSLNDIAGISARTNMLAMNAAIEAAHAGESGRGFSVVASEVRELAETSARVVKQVQSKIASMLERIEESANKSSRTESIFSSIEENTGSAVAVVAEANSMIVEQKESAETMIAKIDDLIAHTREIQELSESQKERSREIQEIMDTVSDSSVQIQESEKRLVELDYVILDILKKNQSIVEECLEELDRA